MKTLVTLSTFGEYAREPLLRLKKAGFQVMTNPFGRKLSPKESLKLYAPDICGVIAGTEEISEGLLKRARSLKVISRCGVGVDNIDLAAAQKRNIFIFKTTHSVVDSVAELTVGLILNCLRFISFSERSIRSGQWQRPMGFLLKGKTLGIIGLGTIGKRVVELCQGFEVRYLACDVKRDKGFAAKHKVQFVNLDSLMRRADIISIHVPFSSQTKGLINSQKLRLMKHSSFLVNTSRGDIVDEKALYRVLKNKEIAGAALDVYTKEPYAGPLTELNNVVLTGHLGSYAREARVSMELEAVDNLIKGLNSYQGGRR